jgi:hypothetical protein
MIVFKKKILYIVEMSTTTDALVAQVFALPIANRDPSKWSLDVVLHVAIEVAGLVKKTSDVKQQNFDLLLEVVNAVLDRLQAKEVSSIPQDSSTVASVVHRWVNLKAVVNTTLPVFFSYSSHLSVPRVVAGWISCCFVNTVAVEEKVVSSLPLVEAVLPVVKEVAVESGAAGVAEVAGVAEADLPKVENAVNQIVEEKQ